jgi:hypothetical protein
MRLLSACLILTLLAMAGCRQAEKRPGGPLIEEYPLPADLAPGS